MASLSQVGLQSNRSSLTTGGGSAPSGGGLPVPSGGPSGGFGGSGGISLQATRNFFVQNYQAKLNSKLAQVSQLAKTDPAGAQSMLLDAWDEFLNGASTFANQPGLRGDFAKQVVSAALGTQSLIQTVDSLWGETGGPSTGVQSLTKAPGAGGAAVPITIGMIGLGTQLIGLARKAKPAAPAPAPVPAPSGQPTDGTNQPPSDGSGGSTGGGAGGGSTGLPGAGANVDPGGFDFTAFMKKYAPYLITAGSIFGNLYGANSAANSAKEAAEIQAKSAKEATELSKNVYRQNRRDLFPGLERGTQALYTLSDMVGLKPGPRVMPTVNPQFLDDPSAPQVVPPATPTASTLATTGQQPLNLDQLAAKYRRTA